VTDKEKMRPDNANMYFCGKALEKLGRQDEGRKVFEELLAAVDKHGIPDNEQVVEGFNFDPKRNPSSLLHFKRYLALDGLGRQQEAETERAKALELDPIVTLRAFSPPRAGW
jgi:hypothetical protein